MSCFRSSQARLPRAAQIHLPKHGDKLAKLTFRDDSQSPGLMAMVFVRGRGCPFDNPAGGKFNVKRWLAWMAA